VRNGRYKELELTDHEIDTLLENKEYRNSLKRLRNSLFRYHKDFAINSKFWDFINLDTSKDWIIDLKCAFEKYFVAHPIVKEYMMSLEKITKK